MVPHRRQVHTILPDLMRTFNETPGFNKLPHPLQRSLLIDGSLKKKKRVIIFKQTFVVLSGVEKKGKVYYYFLHFEK